VTVEDSYVTELTISTNQSSHSGFEAYGIGGLIGRMYSTEVSSCYTGGTITSDIDNVGGLVGFVYNSTESDAIIANCYSAVDLSTSSANVGGIVGQNSRALEITNVLYTGILTPSSLYDTIHLILGKNAGSLEASGCYTYQLTEDETSDFWDDGLNAVAYDTLTELAGDESTGYTNSFYKNRLGDGFLCAWTGNSVQKRYLPAMRGYRADGTFGTGVAYGQIVDGTTYIPSIVDGAAKISEVYAFLSKDREAIASAKITDEEGNPIGSLTNGYVKCGTDWNLATLGTRSWQDTKMGTADDYDEEANDIDFVLSLGTGGSDYQITSIELDGFQSGNENARTWLYNNAEAAGSYIELLQGGKEAILTGGDGSGVLNVDALGIYIRDVTGEDEKITYIVTLQGMRVSSYQDGYTLTVNLIDSNRTTLTLKQNFQFMDAEGNLDGKYIKIGSAAEWNEKMKEYGALGQNVEITGDIDFSQLPEGEKPEMNVTINNLRGKAKTDKDEDNYYIGNIDYTTTASSCRGLIKSAGGDVKDLDFKDIAISWKTTDALTRSGVMGTVYGNVTGCNFSNITLEGGISRFGIIGCCYGSIGDEADDHVTTLKDIYVESRSNYVGGLVGVLYGDLINVNAYGTGTDTYFVKGVGYVGGIVGITFSSTHSKSGHSIIGGTEPCFDPDSAEEHTTTEEGWYYEDMVEGDHLGSTSTYRYDSLSTNYTWIENVQISNMTVTSAGSTVGGVAGALDAENKVVDGFGYVIADNISAENVSVSGTATVAAVFGYGNRGQMLHDISVTNATVEALTGSTAGAVMASHTTNGIDNYKAYNLDTGDRNSGYISTADQITVTGTTVKSAGSYTGGAFGWITWTNMYNIAVSDVDVFANGTYAGGVIGDAGSSGLYLTGAVVSEIEVYNATYTGESTGGVIGHGTVSEINGMTADNILVVAGGSSDSGNTKYTGGIAGRGGTISDNVTVSNIRVYGASYVGGISGISERTITNLTVNPEEGQTLVVSGTGNYVGGIAGSSNNPLSYSSANNIAVSGQGVFVGGVVGMTTSSILPNTFENITVTVDGNQSVTEFVCFDQHSVAAEDRVTVAQYGGSFVGGVVGYIYNHGTIAYNAFNGINITVASSVHDSASPERSGGAYVGGACGGLYQVHFYNNDFDNVSVTSDGARYIGGIFGMYWKQDKSSGSNYASNVVVNAPNASFVGGYAGVARVTSATNTNGIASNTIKATVYAGTGLSAGASKYVGGFAGYTNLYSISSTVVEATIYAPNSIYVGGLVGYVGGADDTEQGARAAGYRFGASYNMVMSKITAYDYVSGMVGYAPFTLYGYWRYQVNTSTTYTGNIRNDLIATQISVKNQDAHAGYMYNCLQDDTTTVITDRGNRTGANTPVGRTYNATYP
jgi:hypothetical protein